LRTEQDEEMLTTLHLGKICQRYCWQRYNLWKTWCFT